MKGNLKRPDFRELMNPLLRTTAGILFFSWFFYRSVFEKTMGTDRAVQGMSSGSC